VYCAKVKIVMSLFTYYVIYSYFWCYFCYRYGKGRYGLCVGGR